MKNNTPALPAGNGFGTNRVDAMDFSETDLLLQVKNPLRLQHKQHRGEVGNYENKVGGRATLRVSD